VTRSTTNQTRGNNFMPEPEKQVISKHMHGNSASRFPGHVLRNGRLCPLEKKFQLAVEWGSFVRAARHSKRRTTANPSSERARLLPTRSRPRTRGAEVAGEVFMEGSWSKIFQGTSAAQPSENQITGIRCWSSSYR
jgi:hypothetical protein